MKILNSQDLKDIFNDKNNKKDYPVFVYTSYNLFQVKKVLLSDDKIIIFTGEVDNPIDNPSEIYTEPDLA